MSSHRTQAASSLLGQMLFGITYRATPPAGEEEPDLSLDSIKESSDGLGVETTITLPTGDRYEVTVKWLSDESP